jgi:hypothetical protein
MRLARKSEVVPGVLKFSNAGEHLKTPLRDAEIFARISPIS